MAVGALIGAYQEDESGGLRALLPLAGRTLLEYQVRCAAAAGAAPIVVVVQHVPQALQDALERLRLDSIGVFAVSDVNEAVSRFEAGSMILLIGDGVAPPAELVAAMAEEPEPAVGTVPDDEPHMMFERIDAESRWSGVALVDAHMLASTAAMLGDWDLQSTLLRRTLQEGALRVPVSGLGGDPMLAEKPDDLQDFQRSLMVGSRGLRPDWVSRYLLPPVEEFATEQLMETGLRPAWLMWAALGLTLAGAFCFGRGWLAAGLVLLLLSMPLDRQPARQPSPQAAPRADVDAPRALAGVGRRPARARLVGDARKRVGRLHQRNCRSRLRRSGPDRTDRDAGRRAVALLATKRDGRGGAVRRCRRLDQLYRRAAGLCGRVLFHRPARAPSTNELTRS